MTLGIDTGGLIAAGLACALGIPVIVFAIRYDYRKKGIGHEFNLARVASGFAVLAVFFFGLLALGIYLQPHWSSAGPLAVVVGFLGMVLGGCAFIKKRKKKQK